MLSRRNSQHVGKALCRWLYPHDSRRRGTLLHACLCWSMLVTGYAWSQPVKLNDLGDKPLDKRTVFRLYQTDAITCSIEMIEYDFRQISPDLAEYIVTLWLAEEPNIEGEMLRNAYEAATNPARANLNADDVGIGRPLSPAERTRARENVLRQDEASTRRLVTVVDKVHNLESLAVAGIKETAPYLASLDNPVLCGKHPQEAAAALLACAQNDTHPYHLHSRIALQRYFPEAAIPELEPEVIQKTLSGRQREKQLLLLRTLALSGQTDVVLSQLERIYASSLRNAAKAKATWNDDRRKALLEAAVKQREEIDKLKQQRSSQTLLGASHLEQAELLLRVCEVTPAPAAELKEAEAALDLSRNHLLQEHRWQKFPQSPIGVRGVEESDWQLIARWHMTQARWHATQMEQQQVAGKTQAAGEHKSQAITNARLASVLAQGTKTFEQHRRMEYGTLLHLFLIWESEVLILCDDNATALERYHEAGSLRAHALESIDEKLLLRCYEAQGDNRAVYRFHANQVRGGLPANFSEQRLTQQQQLIAGRLAAFQRMSAILNEADDASDRKEFQEHLYEFLTGVSGI